MLILHFMRIASSLSYYCELLSVPYTELRLKNQPLFTRNGQLQQ